MAKKKIVVFHPQVPFARGGAEIHAEDLVRELNNRGYDAVCVSIPLKGYPDSALLDSYLMWRMVDLTEVDGEKIDLVIPMKFPTFAVRHPNKVTWLMHQYREAYDLKNNASAGGLNTIPGGERMIELITRMDTMTISESAAIYANSKNVAARLKKYNGIDAIPLYHPPSLAGRFHTGEFGNYILSVGRLVAMKRVDLLIQALPYCSKGIRVKIAGEGKEMESLQRLAAELNVQDRVDFLGFVPDEDLIDLYAGALGVCYPPVDEDYGYVTLEAFLSKKPVLSCWDSGGVLEFLRDGENGYIVNSDAQEMGACFEKLYQNKRMARDFGNDGYQLVKDISWDNVVYELTKTIR